MDYMQALDSFGEKLTDYERIQLMTMVGRERSHERSQAILDARKYLAEGLRKLGIEADDKISLTEVIEIIRRMQQELMIANQLECPTCGYPVEEINRNGLYIAARCGWCNEVVHIEKE